MKYILIALFLFISSTAYERELQQYVIIDKSIRKLSPTLSKSYSKRIAKAVLASSKKWGLDWKVMLAVLQQESSMRMDPGSCLKRACADFGIGQINFKTWGKALALSKKKLVTIPEYNIDIVGRVLSSIKLKHSRETSWFTRYNSNNPIPRNEYRNHITPIHQRIISFSKREYYKAS